MLKSDNKWQIRQDKRDIKSWNEPTSTLQEKESLCQVQDKILYTTKSEKVLRNTSDRLSESKH